MLGDDPLPPTPQVAAPTAPASTPAPPRDVLKLADVPGFVQLGVPVPENVTMLDVVNSLPAEVSGAGLGAGQLLATMYRLA